MLHLLDPVRGGVDASQSQFAQCALRDVDDRIRSSQPGVIAYARPRRVFIDGEGTVTLRPNTHGVRDVAALSVELLLAAMGWATEPILKDYGEDLLVQPSWDGRMEDFKLFVQVKGLLHGRDRDAWRVSVEHARRWERSSEYVVFVVWDVSTGSGRYCLPKHQVRALDLFDSSAAITLTALGVLDRTALERVHNIALFDHYERLIMSRKAQGAWDPFATRPTEPVRASTASDIKEILWIALDLLRRMAVVDDRMKVDAQFKEMRNGARAMSEVESYASELKLDAETTALIPCLLIWMRERTGILPPLELAHTCAQVLRVAAENGITSLR